MRATVVREVRDASGRIVGRIMRTESGGTFYAQVRRVPRGACVNYGPNARYL